MRKYQICIPTIGEKIILAEPWTFILYKEKRNQKMIAAILPEKERWKNTFSWPVTLPPDWELKVGRIYIRQHRSNFDSVTFQCHCNGKSVRFWVKLEDANKIVAKNSED